MKGPFAFRRRGMILVVSAPSGAGKTTLTRRLLKTFPDLSLSVSYTTRPARAHEVQGQDYCFVSEEEFLRLQSSGAFAEWARVHGFLYGTPRAPLEAALATGRDIVLDIDVQGARQIRKIYPEAVLVFVLPPSWEELERRLRLRRTETEEAIEGRLLRAREEARELPHYDYWLINDELDRAVKVLESIVRAEKARVSRIAGQWGV